MAKKIEMMTALRLKINIRRGNKEGARQNPKEMRKTLRVKMSTPTSLFAQRVAGWYNIKIC
jgi:hypothetical protein